MCDLATSNYHVTPGDILLLKSHQDRLPGRLLGKANRMGQRMTRRREALYTHVAIVVSSTHIVDAMPKTGVSFRLWSDIEDHYDIENCRVARHEGLASQPDSWRQVWQSGWFFLAQNYRWQTLISRRAAVRDQEGLVCSHLVAAMMERLGTSASRHRAMRTLPVDIDEHTRRQPWRQFPLKESGLFSGAARPSADDPYWAASHRQTEARLSFEDPAALPPDFTKSEPGAEPMPADVRSLDQKTHDLIKAAATLQTDLARTAVDFEKKMLSLTEAVAAGSPEALRLSQALIDLGAPWADEPPPLNGATFLEQWHQFYRDRPSRHAPIFLVQEDAEPALLARHRDLLDVSLAQAEQLVASQMALFDRLFQGIQATFKQTPPRLPRREQIELACQHAQLVLDHAEWLRSEPLDTIEARLAGWADLQQETRVWMQARPLGPAASRQAIHALERIHRHDLAVREWLTGPEAGLRQILAILKDMLPRFAEA